SSYFDIDAAITDNWLTGFVEAEGCFSIYSDGGYFYIEFSLSQKLDIILLELIRRKLHIPGKIVKYSYINVLKTKNKRAINNIKDKFEGKMKGIKSLVFKLWLRAYYKTKSNSNYNKTFQNLCKINKLLTKTNFKLNNKNKFLISNLSNIVSNNVKLGNKSYHTSSNISNLNPFKQLSFRSFTSLSTQSIINPWFITGFTDAEPSFKILLRRSLTHKLGWSTIAKFRIELHVKDFELLNSIRSYFNDIGQLEVISTRKLAYFEVTKLNDLVNIVIPHFDKYPLQSVK